MRKTFAQTQLRVSVDRNILVLPKNSFNSINLISHLSKSKNNSEKVYNKLKRNYHFIIFHISFKVKDKSEKVCF